MEIVITACTPFRGRLWTRPSNTAKLVLLAYGVGLGSKLCYQCHNLVFHTSINNTLRRGLILSGPSNGLLEQLFCDTLLFN